MIPASILIADDESNIRMMLRTALESDGYAVEEAGDGRAALEAVRRRTPDLVVLDLNMPVLDGMGVLEQLKAMTGPKPRVVILTAYGSIAAAVRATRLGAVDFLEKPVTPDELRQTVRGVLTEPEPALAVVGAAGTAGGAYEQAVDRIRRSLRLAELTDAETLLTHVAERRGRRAAEYFNLLGVLYEAQHRWRLARKCYGKAIAADTRYGPSQMNMRRIYELYTFGRSPRPILMGDERGEGEPVRLHESWEANR